MSRIVAVTSGKGGTGKTSLSVNLAFALGAAGRRVCLLDADLGLSNVDVLLGLTPTYTLEHVLFEGLPMERAIIPAGRFSGGNVDLIPGGSGVSRLADLDAPERRRLAQAFASLDGYDYIFVDGSPGVSRQVVALCLACPEVLLVVNPDPASITDAYALVKVLHENGLRASPHLVINRSASAGQARAIAQRLGAALGKYLNLGLRFLGHVPQDPHLPSSTARQRPLVEMHPASHAGRAVLALARSLDEAGLPAGAHKVSPLSFAAKALARMREAAPSARPALAGGTEHAARVLDEALDLATRLERESDGKTAALAQRLAALLNDLRADANAQATRLHTMLEGLEAGAANRTGPANGPDAPETVRTDREAASFPGRLAPARRASASVHPGPGLDNPKPSPPDAARSTAASAFPDSGQAKTFPAVPGALPDPALTFVSGAGSAPANPATPGAAAVATAPGVGPAAHAPSLGGFDAANVVPPVPVIDPAVVARRPGNGRSARPAALLEADPFAASLPLSPPPPARPVRVTVISSDEAMGDIIRESLGMAGLDLAPDAQAQAAVIYWLGEQESLKQRLRGREDLGYVWVRPLTGREEPQLGGRGLVMDMPLRLGDLAGAVKSLAGGDPGFN